MIVEKSFGAILVFSVATIILINVAFAQVTNSNELVGIRTLNYAMDFINCRVQFTVGVINSLISNSPTTFSNLAQYIQILQTDQATLKNYTYAGDIGRFRSFIKNNFDPDYKTIRDAVTNQRDNANLAPNVVQAIKANYTALSAIYQTCAFASLNNYATDKVNAYATVITNYQLEMFSLNSKGVDIGPIVSLLQQENAQIIIPLSTIVNTINPNVNATSQLRVALNKYCLFDGCVNGLNGHLASNFEIQKQQAILNYMKIKPKYAKASAYLNQAQNYLDTAQTELSTIGTSAYNSMDQANQVWNDIYQSAQILRAVESTYGGG